ncbi:MAG TPA: IMP dehydrogenase, partial [Chloroflexota bacterium]|nr:IMP dehydrogenase [Chloroflexota bacterium]
MATTIRDTDLPDLGDFTAELFTPERNRLRPAYGFDDVAIVPGVETIHPDDVDLGFELGGQRFAIPFVAAAMDCVVDVPFATALGRLGGLAVLNLEGLQTRYERPAEPLAEIAAAPRETVTELMQRLYRAPLRDELVARRVAELKAAGVIVAVSSTPSLAERLGPVAAEAGV